MPSTRKITPQRTTKMRRVSSSSSSSGKMSPVNLLGFKLRVRILKTNFTEKMMTQQIFLILQSKGFDEGSVHKVQSKRKRKTEEQRVDCKFESESSEEEVESIYTSGSSFHCELCFSGSDNFTLVNASTQFPSVRSSKSSNWSGLVNRKPTILFVPGVGLSTTMEENNTDAISSEGSVTVVEVNGSPSANKGHENKAFEHDSLSGSGSGSSASTSPEPPINFEMKDMSPNSKPKSSKIDQLDSSKSSRQFGDDYLISVNEHHKKGRK